MALGNKPVKPEPVLILTVLAIGKGQIDLFEMFGALLCSTKCDFAHSEVPVIIWKILSKITRIGNQILRFLRRYFGNLTLGEQGGRCVEFRFIGERKALRL